jgi:hypothetical protein
LYKANILLYKYGHRWQSLYSLIEARKLKNERIVEHSSFILSKIIEKEVQYIDRQDVDKKKVDTAILMSYQDKTKSLLVTMNSFTENYIKFWKMLLSKSPSRISI